jgi:heptosyltransferase-2
MKPLPKPQNVEKVAIRLTNWVRDCVMNTPLIARIRESFPNARIIALGRKSVTPLFRPHPCIDDVWDIDDKSRAGFLDAVRRLRAERIDVGFLLPNSLKAAALFAAGGVTSRIGYDRDGRRFLLTHPIKLRPDDLAVHEVKYYTRLLHPFNIEPGEPKLQLLVADTEQTAMREWLAERRIDTSLPIFGINPAAFYGTAKRWLPDRFAATGRNLLLRHGGNVVVTGLPAERDVADEVCRAGGPGFHNAAGEMSLRQLMAFLSLCRLYVTNDSGAMHIAAAFGTPIVAVFGSTDWVTTAPWTPTARLVRAETPCAPCLLRHCPIDHRCMTQVTVDMVTQAAAELLEHHPARA